MLRECEGARVTEGVLDACLCCGGVGGKWVGAWTRVCRGGVLLWLCEV